MASVPTRAALLFLLPLVACGAPAGPTPTDTAGGEIPAGALPWSETAIPRIRVPLGDSPGRGADRPLVTMVVFSDFECGYCREANPVLEALLAANADTLRVHFRHLPLPFHQHADLAAMATIEARAQRGDEGFWAMHDRLFAHPDALGLDGLIAHAEALGLDVPRFRIAMRGQVHRDVIEDDLTVADRVGADGTPTFYVNGRPVLGALPQDEFQVLIDREVQLGEQALAQGVPRARIYDAAMRDALAEAPRRRAPEPDAGEDAPTELDTSVTYRVPAEGATVGPPAAPVTIVTFSDFECPFCSRVLPTLAALRERYGERLRVVFRHNPLPFHANASPAAQAALEARAQRGDEAFWQMHDLLFANQGSLSFDDLVSYASTLGLDLARFRQALEVGTHEEAIEADQQLARRLGARGTPSFFVNGRLIQGAQPLAVFQGAVDAALERAAAERERGTSAADVYDALIRDGHTEAVYRPASRPEARAAGPVRIAVPPGAPRLGASEPALVIQMFTDFQCPFCGMVRPTIARLLQTHPNVQFVFRHLPLPFHADARPAAIAAIEVQRQRGDAAFWQMTDLLFENQRALSRTDLMGYAAQVGADPAAVGAAIDAQTHGAVVDADLAAITEAGLRMGTPAFVVGEHLLMGAQPYEVFDEAIREALAAH